MSEGRQRAFYNSKAWRACKACYLEKVNRICERCGAPAAIVHHRRYITPANVDDPDVTLNHDNLEALCRDCHNKEHFWQGACEPGLRFDANGDLIKG